MNTYYFYLNLGKQRKSLEGKYFVKVITCKDPYEDGLTMFIKEIEKDGRYLAIEDDMFYKKL